MEKRKGQRSIAHLFVRAQPNIAIRPVLEARESWWLNAPADGFTRRAEAEQERMQYGQHAHPRPWRG